MTAPRNERAWPDELAVGDPASGGRLTVGERPNGSIWVNAYRGTGVTVDLSDADLDLVCRWLDTHRRKRTNRSS